MKKMTTGIDIDKMRYLQSIAQSLVLIANELNKQTEQLKDQNIILQEIREFVEGGFNYVGDCIIKQK